MIEASERHRCTVPPSNNRSSGAKDPMEVIGAWLLPFIKPFVRFAQRVDGGAIDLRRPATARSHLEREMGRMVAAADAVTAEDLARAFAAIPEGALLRPRDVRLSARSAIVVAYLKRVEQQIPLATFPLVTALDLGSRAFFDAVFSVPALLEDAGRLRRERRSSTLRQMAIVGIESLYFRLVDLVYFAECLVRGVPATARRGGSRLRLLCGDWATESLCGFLELDANRIRNAAAHDGGWEYLPSADEIRLSDRGWSRQVRNRDLYHQLRQMMLDFRTIFDVQRAITTPAMLRLVHEAGVLRALRDPQHARVKWSVAERALNPAFKRAAQLGVLPPSTRQRDGVEAAGLPLPG